MRNVLKVILQPLQNAGIQRLTELIAELFPVIISVVMIMLVVGIVMSIAGGKNKKRGGGILLLAFVFTLLMSATLVSADGEYSASVSPGSTSVFDGMPTTETFRGLDPGELHEVRQIVDSVVAHDNLAPDAQGILIVSVTPYRSGSNPYAIWNSTHELTTFTIQNNSIMDYLIPIFTIMIMVSVLGLILGIFTGKK